MIFFGLKVPIGKRLSVKHENLQAIVFAKFSLVKYATVWLPLTINIRKNNNLQVAIDTWWYRRAPGGIGNAGKFSGIFDFGAMATAG